MIGRINRKADFRPIHFMKLKPLGFCQNFIKRFQLAQCKLLLERKKYMGVEGGSPGGVATAVSIGPAISSRPAISAGIETSLAVRFGPSVTALFSAQIAEGPVGRSFLENTIPFQPQFGLGQPVPEVFQAGLSDINLDPGIKAIQAGPHLGGLLRGLPLPFEDHIPVTVRQPLFGLDEVIARPKSTTLSRPGILVEEKPILVTKARVQPQVESRASSELVQTIATPIPQKQEVEELVEEKQLVDKQEEQEVNTKNSEEAEEFRLKIVEDELVSEQRRVEIKGAIKKAFEAAENLGLSTVVARIAAKFLPSEHEGNRGQIVKKKGPDGTLTDTVEAISTDDREFNSRQEAEQALLPLVDQFRPAKRAKEGKTLSLEEVLRTFKHHLIKPKIAVEIIVQRIIKKRIQVLSYQPTLVETVKEEIKPQTENSLEDLNLTEVFQTKAG